MKIKYCAICQHGRQDSNRFLIVSFLFLGDVLPAEVPADGLGHLQAVMNSGNDVFLRQVGNGVQLRQRLPKT